MNKDLKDMKPKREECNFCNGQQMSEADIKIACDELMAKGEWFKSFDDNFFPIELDHMENSYHYALQKLTRKCHSAMKYYHLCNKYHKEMKHEMDEIQRIYNEIKQLEHAYHHSFKLAQKPLPILPITNSNKSKIFALSMSAQGISCLHSKDSFT